METPGTSNAVLTNIFVNTWMYLITNYLYLITNYLHLITNYFFLKVLQANFDLIK
jgi:hypothetical protein